MTSATRRNLALAGALAIFVASSGLTAWRVAVWQRGGWAGIWAIPRSPSVERPEGGAEVKLVHRGGPAQRAGIREGETILEIDGGAATARANVLAVLDRARSGGTVTYRVAREGKVVEVPVVLESPLRNPGVLTSLVTGIPVALATLAIGLFVFLRRRDDVRAVLFVCLCAAIGASFPLLSLTLVDTYGGRATVPILVAMGGQEAAFWTLAIVDGALVALLGFHLSLVFPKPTPLYLRHPRLPHWTYATATLALLLPPFATAGAALALFLPGPVVTGVAAAVTISGVALLAVAKRRGARWATAPRGKPWRVAGAILVLGASAIAGIAPWISPIAAGVTLGALWGITWFAGQLLGVVALFVAAIVSLFGAFHRGTLEERRQVAWPLYGISTSLAVFVVTVALSPWVVDPSTNTGATIVFDLASKLGYLLIPLSFAFAIFKYRLMDVTLVAMRTVVYGAATGVLGLAYLGVVALLGGLVAERFAGGETWLTVGATLGVAALFVPVRNTVQGWVERRFFRRRRDYPDALARIAAALREPRDPAESMGFLAEQVVRAENTRSVVVFRAASSRGDFLAEAKVGVRDDVVGELALERDGAIARRAAEADGPFAIEPERLSAAEGAKLRGIGASVVVPVRYMGELLAILALGRKLARDPYEVEDLAFLREVAARLGEALHRHGVARERVEVDEARDLQRNLLPKSLPEIPGLRLAASWRSARAVGGDYYDAIVLPDGGLLVVVADVSGKGLAAALLMSNLQAAVRAFAAEAASPAALLKRVHRIVSANIRPNRYITACCAVVRPETRELVYANAGHERPIVVRAGGSVSVLAEAGFPLAMFPDVAYADRTLRLEPGDRVLLFTDGASEASGPRGEEFGARRLAEALSRRKGDDAAAAVEGLFDELRRFGGGDFDDDVTLLLLEAAP